MILLRSALLLALLSGPLVAHESLDARVAQLDRVLQESSLSTAPARVRRAELLRRAGRFTAALDDLQRVRREWPQTPELELGFGRVFFDLGYYSLAAERLDRQLAGGTFEEEALRWRAKARLALGRSADSLADLDRLARECERADPQLELERARLALQLDPSGAAALARLDEGLARLGALPVLLLAAIDIEQARADYAAALERLAPLLAAADRQEGWLLRRARLLTLAGRLDEAGATLDASRRALARLAPRLRQSAAMRALQAEQAALFAELSTQLAHRAATVAASLPCAAPKAATQTPPATPSASQ